MNKNKTLIIFLIIILILSTTFSLINFNPKNPISIAAWNLHIFGEKKANNQTLMNQYYEIISQFDIIFLQEIRNKDQTAVIALCTMFNQTHECITSSRAGTTRYKEQYILLYDKEYELLKFTDYNLKNYTQEFMRPPIKAKFKHNNINFTIYGIHVRPTDAYNEIRNLEKLVINQGNVMVLGDLNSDCSYYSRGDDFIEWYWLINDDTSLSSRFCTYDQILVNENFYNYFLYSSVYRENIEIYLSDHYLVYAIFDLS